MVVEGRELTFASLNKTDNGTYRCEASNLLGTTSAEYVLFVYGEFRDRPLPRTNQETCAAADKDPSESRSLNHGPRIPDYNIRSA